MTWFAERFDAPLGEMVAVTDARGCLRALDWVSHADRMKRLLGLQPDYRKPVNGGPTGVGSTLNDYFDGDIEALAKITVSVF